ncbi:acyl transferase/acyl hydrolase/lysophospholipase [Mycena leptocephala]|nr:acyl transferase/acyl hydrolase/lysophospholipase [Mycena leptocephala]
MWRMKTAENLDSVPHPCDYFDLMGGSNTGGLIALMLGPLRMSTKDAIEVYADLSKQVFSDLKHLGGDEKFKATKLETVIKKVVQDHSQSGSSDERMKVPGAAEEACKTFVCAMYAHNLNASIPVLFRTYDNPNEPAIDCTIWEAARATSAAPEFFKRIEIGLRREEFVGSVGCNNPTTQVLEEAELIFPNRHVACIVSIGAGHPKTIAIPKPSVYQGFLQATNQENAGRFRHFPNVYFRFNVEQGIQNIERDEWERLGEISSHTKQYMKYRHVDRQLGESVMVLRERIGIVPTAQLNALPSEVKMPPQRKATEKAEKALRKDKKDYNTPKRALSAYMFFSQDWRERIKAENPDAGFGEVGKLLGAKWKELDDEEKNPYVEQAAKDKARAENEKAAYEGGKKSAAASSGKADNAAGHPLTIG